jgi:hypothetical protein
VDEMSDLIRLISTRGSDEVNHAGVSYRVTQWNTVVVPADAVPSLTNGAGFYIADDYEELLRHSTIDELYEAAWALPLGKARSTLLAILRSPNSLSHLTQSISIV